MWPVYIKYQAMNATKAFLFLILKEICDADIICVDVDENNNRDIARAKDNHRGLHHLYSQLMPLILRITSPPYLIL